jgi:hypothetical protein
MTHEVATTTTATSNLPPALMREGRGSAMNIGQMWQNVVAFEAAQRMAIAVSKSSMLPDVYQNDVGNCLLLLGIANRFEHMGIDLMMVAQNLVPVHGKFSWQGQFIIAVINSSTKYLEPLEFEWKHNDKGESVACRAVTTRKKRGGKDGETEAVNGPWVTWEMAEAEGWTKSKDYRDKKTGEMKKGMPSKWHTLRDLMFTYRAASYFSRTNCPELLMGMPAADEVEDTLRDITPTKQIEESVPAEESNEDAKESEDQPTTQPDQASGEATVGSKTRNLFNQ